MSQPVRALAPLPFDLVYEGQTADWVRLFRPDGSVLPTEGEAERQRADAEQQRAEKAEAELARLRALLDGSP